MEEITEMVKGFILVAFAASCLGIMPSFQKQVLMDGLSVNNLMLYSNWVITLVCLGMSLIKKRNLRVSKKQLVQALLMGVVGFANYGNSFKYKLFVFAGRHIHYC